MLNGFMNKAVIDTNVLVAVTDSNDKWHEKTPALLDALRFQNIGIVWFDCVINETISVLARRTEEQKRSGQLSLLLDSLIRMIPPEDITWISSETRRLYDDILEQILKSQGKLNFHDAMMQ